MKIVPIIILILCLSGCDKPEVIRVSIPEVEPDGIVEILMEAQNILKDEPSWGNKGYIYRKDR